MSHHYLIMSHYLELSVTTWYYLSLLGTICHYLVLSVSLLCIICLTICITTRYNLHHYSVLSISILCIICLTTKYYLHHYWVLSVSVDHILKVQPDDCRDSGRDSVAHFVQNSWINNEEDQCLLSTASAWLLERQIQQIASCFMLANFSFSKQKKT